MVPATATTQSTTYPPWRTILIKAMVLSDPAAMVLRDGIGMVDTTNGVSPTIMADTTVVPATANTNHGIYHSHPRAGNTNVNG